MGRFGPGLGLRRRQLAIFEGYPAGFSPDGQRVATVQAGRVQVHDIALSELLDWGCQWLHNYLEYDDRATNADRALCNLPPREVDPSD